jgi:hypothetical protein
MGGVGQQFRLRTIEFGIRSELEDSVANHRLDGNCASVLRSLMVLPSVFMCVHVFWHHFCYIHYSATAFTRCIETTALGRVGSSDASVIVSTESLWAAVFASFLLNDEFGLNDVIGGGLIVSACLALSLKCSDFDWLFDKTQGQEEWQ